MASLWEEIRARAVEVHVADHLRQRLERGDKLRVKLGMDPTAPDLHVGHLVVLDVLRLFQDHGHTAILIIGDYTAMIGDPSGKSETRPMLSREQVEENARTYLDQIFLVLDPDRTEVHGNSEWLAELTAEQILRLLGKATLQQVLQREDFALRLKEESAIGAHELLYTFNQAYDSVAIRADVEIGGTDQLFNLLFGREIQRAYSQEPQDVAVFPLLEGPDGRRMGKSLGNYIGLAEPPEQIYGKTMSIPDPLTERYLHLVSGLDLAEIDRILALPPRDAKAALAFQLVKRLHGEEAALGAEADFDRKFRQRQRPESIQTLTTGFPLRVVEAMQRGGLVKSGNEARRNLQQGGVRINDEVVNDDRPLKPGDVISVGRKRWLEVVQG
jgi:tyrosyl-tRNA synthetase